MPVISPSRVLMVELGICPDELADLIGGER